MPSIGDSSTFQNLINLINSRLGKAAYKNVPVSGNAANDEVVLGNDSRLTDSRNPKTHTHTTSDITNLDLTPYQLQQMVSAVTIAGSSYTDVEPAIRALSENESDITITDDTVISWSGVSSLYGQYIWTDGENIYYSNGSGQYVLNKTTGAWESKTWTGLTNFLANNIWVDGDNVYYSDQNTQYELDKVNSAWIAKTWGTIDPGYANKIWTDGNDVYYSNGNTQYVLDRATSNWSQKTWTGMTNFHGQYIWTDGENIYYSNGSTQCILDVANSTWSEKTWSGLTSFSGEYIWTDGKNIYYSYNNNQYVLDKESDIWNAKIWSYPISGNNIWTDGENTYYSDSGATYKQLKIIYVSILNSLGKPGGIATLDANGKVPTSQLPSYVDDVLEYANLSSFPATGETGKIYVALDTNKTYRWGGTAYVEISESLALGTTSSTAFAGDRGVAIEGKIPSSASSSNKLATASDIPTITAQTTDPGAGSALTTGNLILVYEA